MKRYNKLKLWVLSTTVSLLLITIVGCPILTLDGLNNPADPDGNDYQGGAYLVTFDSQGGSAPEPAEMIVYEGDLYGELPGPVNGDLLFGGWWIEPGGNGSIIDADSVVTLTRNLTLYAHWGEYIVTFDSQGGSVPDPGSKVVKSGSIYGTLATTDKGGYTFGGWWIEPNGSGSEITSAAIVSITEDQTLYAKWDAKTYAVSFDWQGGSGGNLSVVATYGAGMPMASAPTRARYDFGGYYTGTNGTGVPYYTATMASVRIWDLATNTTLYAKWVIIPMTYVEGGSFQMGSSSGEYLESPVHTVRVGSFNIGAYEVTQAEYEAIIGSNPSNWKGEQLPVDNVSWYEAVAYCNALSKREGREEAYTINGENVSCDWESNGYRLPTEAEWEYAARGGVESRGYIYAGSNTIGDVAWYSGNSGSATHEVGGKAANELGLYDMGGNVWEWCWDWITYYSSSPTVDPTGPTSGSHRVIRGGGWRDDAQAVRVTIRSNSWPSNRGSNIGFRVLVPAE